MDALTGPESLADLADLADLVDLVLISSISIRPRLQRAAQVVSTGLRNS
ncbi:hypothetical protein ACGF0K_41225 [Streptomyces sp. NPDC048156]